MPGVFRIDNNAFSGDVHFSSRWYNVSMKAAGSTREAVYYKVKAGMPTVTW